MTFEFYLRLFLTGSLLFLFAVPVLRATEASTPDFVKLMVILVTLAAILCFFGGGFGMIWTPLP